MSPNNIDYHYFVRLVANSRIYVYGAGFNAKKFTMAMDCLGIKENIHRYVVSKLNNEEYIDNIPIVEVEQVQITKNDLVCIAVHNSVLEDIMDILRKKNITNYIWVVPYLDTMIYGEPIERKEKRTISDIIMATPTYGFAVKYLAMKSFEQGEELGRRIYIKACMCDGTSRNIAEKRYKNYENFANKMKNGVIKQLPEINITTNNNLIDGTHRIMINYCSNVLEIMCNVFEVKSLALMRMFTKASIYKDDESVREYFTTDEMRRIEEADFIIRSSYNCFH